MQTMAESSHVASGVSEDEEGQHECEICKEPYKLPQLLHCMHTFCGACIQQLLQRSDAEVGERVVVCPKCRFETKVYSVLFFCIP